MNTRWTGKVGGRKRWRVVLAAGVIALAATPGRAAEPELMTHPAYRMFSVSGGKIPELSAAELDLFARTFSAAHGGFSREQIEALKARNPGIELVNYMNSTYTRTADEAREIEGRDKSMVCLTRAGALAGDIGADERSFRIMPAGSKTVKVRASTVEGDVSKSTKAFVCWIAIGGELMRVDAFDATSGQVTVTRGYAGGGAARAHRAGELVFSPVYVGQPHQKGGSAGNFPGGKAAHLRYCLDPFSENANRFLAEIALDTVKRGFDGPWLDTCNAGDFNLCNVLGEAARPWDWRNTPGSADGPAEYPPTVFRDGQDAKMAFIQNYLKAKTGRWPVLLVNNLRSDDVLNPEHGRGMAKLLISTPEKPRPVDGFCMENFFSSSRRGNFDKLMTALRTGIQLDLAVMPNLHDAGAFSVRDTEPDNADRAQLEAYAYACYLMAVLPDQARRKAMFGTYAFYSKDGRRYVKVDPQYFWPIGRPLDAWTDPAGYTAYAIGERLYRREFEHATVLLNAGKEAATVELGRAMTDPRDGAAVERVTLPAASGRILLRE